MLIRTNDVFACHYIILDVQNDVFACHYVILDVHYDVVPAIGSRTQRHIFRFLIIPYWLNS